MGSACCLALKKLITDWRKKQKTKRASITRVTLTRGVKVWPKSVVLKLGSTEPQGFGVAVAGVRLRSE